MRLGRQLGTPNIASKGKLLPRTALVPLSLYPATHPLRASAPQSQGTNAGAKKLIEELGAPDDPHSKEPEKGPVVSTPLKSILKSPGSSEPSKATTAKIEVLGEGAGEASKPATVTPTAKLQRPRFEWAKVDDRIHFTVHAPKLVRLSCD